MELAQPIYVECCNCGTCDHSEYDCPCDCHELPYDEPDHDDSVKFCPNCERPNQFGELCVSCQRDEDLAEAEGLRWADEHENAPCMWWGGK